MKISLAARGVIYTGLAALLLSGCNATLNQSIPFAYTPALASSSTINAKVGLEKCQDVRGPKQGARMTSVKDVDERMTDQILLDLRGSQLFSALDYPAQPDKDALTLQCRIQSFVFQPHPSVLLYIPVVGSIIMMFGVPACHPAGDVEVHFTLVDAKSKVVGDYTRAATEKNWWTSYHAANCSDLTLLAGAFKDTMDHLKEDLLKDKPKIENHKTKS